MLIPLPAFEPDRSRFNGNALPNILNVLPHADGWAPHPANVNIIPAYEILTDENGAYLTDENGNYLITGPGGVALLGTVELPAACQTACYVRTSSGTRRYFAFTATAIYEFEKTDLTWVDVSRAGSAYAAEGPWSFAVFGTTLYAQNGTDTEQYIDIDAGTVFADNATAPVAGYIATIGDFLVRGAISGTPNKLQWSALNDPTSNSAGLDGSDYQIFPEGEEITGIIPMSFGALVVLRTAIYAMRFSPDSGYVFTFGPITVEKGSSSPWSITVLNQDDFIMHCSDGWVRGPQLTPIGAERVDKWYMSNTTQSDRELAYSSIDPERKVCWIKYTDTNGENMLLGYNWQLNRWFRSNLDVQTIFRAASVGVTIDGMDEYFATIDAANVPIDSPAFDGGVPAIAVITADGYMGFLSGTNLAATIETNEISINGTGRAMINGGRLDGDAVDVSVTLSVADYKGGTMTEKSAVTPSTRTRNISLRGDGRVHKIKLDVAAGADWTIISGIDVDVVGTGKS